MEAHCRALFAYEGSDRAHHIDAQAPYCGCEACSYSAHGPVAPTEVLIRFVVSPHHVNKQKTKVRASVLTHAETIGLSSFREDLVSDEELLERAVKIVDTARKIDASAGIYGVLRMAASEVKSPRQEGTKTSAVYCIFDCPDGGVESHVDVYQRVAQADDQVRTARRQWLFGIVGAHFVPVASFRGGLLMSLAPPQPA